MQRHLWSTYIVVQSFTSRLFLVPFLEGLIRYLNIEIFAIKYSLGVATRYVNTSSSVPIQIMRDWDLLISLLSGKFPPQKGVRGRRGAGGGGFLLGAINTVRVTGTYSHSPLSNRVRSD